MSAIKVSEIRSKSVVDLKAELLELQKEQFNLRIQVTSGQNNNTARLNTVRKDIAKMKTLINEKNRLENESTASVSQAVGEDV